METRLYRVCWIWFGNGTTRGVGPAQTLTDALANMEAARNENDKNGWGIVFWIENCEATE